MSRRISKAPSDVEWLGETESGHILWVGSGLTWGSRDGKGARFRITAVVQVPRLGSTGAGNEE